MTYRSERFARECIATSGLAIMDPRIAYELRPDMWGSFQDCAITFGRNPKLDGTHRMTASIEGIGEVRVFARSLDNLEKRIEWIVGRRVTSLVQTPPDVQQPAPTDPRELAAQSKKADSIERLRKLAAQTPPDHDCSLRREILAARKELEEAGA